MERLTFLSSFVKSRNRHLFQFPIYRKFGTGEKNANTGIVHCSIQFVNEIFRMI